MKTIVMLSVIILAGCTATNPPRTDYCGFIKTGQLARDLAAPHRTDPEWYEAVIAVLARQVDCLQGNGPTQRQP